jgi:hypothetical protein
MYFEATNADAVGCNRKIGTTVSGTVGAPACATPSIGTVSPPLNFILGQAFNGTITINNATSSGISGLPTGINRTGATSGSNYVWTLSGTPTVNQSYNISVTGGNSPGGCAASGMSPTLVVSGKVGLTPCTTPTIGTLDNTTFQKGVYYTGNVTIENATGITVTGLPTGVVYSSNSKVGTTFTARFLGTPTTSGQIFDFKINAINNPGGCGQASTGLTSVATGTVNKEKATAPTIRKIATNSLSQPDKINSIFQANFNYNSTLTISNATSATITGLPAGITATGVRSGTSYIFTITGKPTVGGESWAATVTATNEVSGVETNTISGSAGSGTVQYDSCVLPTATLTSENNFRIFDAYTGTIDVFNCTSAPKIYGLPIGITATSSTPFGTGYRITISGTASGPPGATYNIRFDATNTGSTCFTNTATAIQIATGYIKCIDPDVQTVSPNAFASGVAYTGSITVKQAQTAGIAKENLANLPSGITVTGQAFGRDYLLTLSGTPNKGGQVYDIKVNASSQFCTQEPPRNLVNVSAGTGTVTKSLAERTSPKPSVGFISSNSFKIETKYTGTVKVTNATSATISGLPAGITAVGAASGSDYIFTLSGTPTSTSQPYNIAVSAENNLADKEFSSSVANISAGSGTVTNLSPCVPIKSQPTPLPMFREKFEYNHTFYINGESAIFSTSSASVAAGIPMLPTGITISPAPANSSYPEHIAFSIQGTPTLPYQKFGPILMTINAPAKFGICRAAETYTGVEVYSFPDNAIFLNDQAISTGVSRTAPGFGCSSSALSTYTVFKFQANVAFTSYIGLQNTTTATITGLPTGITATGAASGTSYVFTISGTPTVSGQAYDIKIQAINSGKNCVDSSSSLSFPNNYLGSGTVAPPPACTTPTTTSLGTAVFQKNVATGETITVSNATSATITGLPTGVTSTGAVSGANYVLTLSGTPTTEEAWTASVSATNACGGGKTTSTATLAAGSGTVRPAPLCTKPTVSQLSSTNFQAAVAYSATLTIPNATIATISGLPTGITVTGAASDNGYVLTLSGTPTVASQTWAATISGTNACGGGKTTSEITNIPIGKGTVAAAPPCAAPSIGTLSSTQFQKSVAYSGSVTITNATSATITGLPTGITSTGAANGANYILTLSGTPTISIESYTILVDATNSGSTCSTNTSRRTVLTGTVSAAPLCVVPSVSLTFGATAFQRNVAYSGTITITNATGATISGLPTGVAATGQQDGVNYKFTVSGTPTTADQKWEVLVSADNDCGGGKTKSSIIGSSVGTGTVTAAPICTSPLVILVDPNTFVEQIAYTGKITVKNATKATLTGTIPTGINQTGAVDGADYVINLSGTPTTSGQVYAMVIAAENACGGGKTTSVVSNLNAGSGKVDPAPLCTTPTISAFATPIFQKNVAYGPTTLTINNATTATLSGLPSGVTAVGAVSGLNYVFTVSGTPTDAAQSWKILVTATNDCGSGKLKTVINNFEVSSGVVLDAPLCVAPTVPTLQSTALQVSTAYGPTTLTITNATTATVTGLPAGITAEGAISGANYVFTISGTPTTAGTWAAKVSAANACGEGKTTAEVKDISIGNGTVAAAPQCDTPTVTTTLAQTQFQKNVPYGPVTILISPVTDGDASITINGLPGINGTVTSTSSSVTYTLSGTPTTVGTYSIIISAKNECGGIVGQLLNKQIASGTVLGAPRCAAPDIPLLSNTVFQRNVAYTTTTLTIANATIATLSGMPAGITATGAISGSNYVLTISGTPTTAGSWTIKASAANVCEGGNDDAEVSDIQIGSGTVAAAPECDTPIAAQLTSTQFQKNVAYGPATLTVSKATAATITGLPKGITQTGAVNAGNYVITISGTPTDAAEVWSATVSATNACGSGKTTTEIKDVKIGNGIVASAPVCDTPSVSKMTTTQSAFQRNVAYGPVTITVSKATVATISGLPTGITVTGAPSGANYVLTLSGTPTTEDQPWGATVNATNACGGGKAAAQITEFSVGAGVVAKQPACTTPVVGTVAPNVFVKGVPYNGSITVTNATLASFVFLKNRLPSGIKATGAKSGNNYVITLTGTPTVSGQSYSLIVKASNFSSTCTTAIVEEAPAGSGKVGGA